jgi:hypothetical protein
MTLKYLRFSSEGEALMPGAADTQHSFNAQEKRSSSAGFLAGRRDKSSHPVR